jgi:hypothetical protein
VLRVVIKPVSAPPSPPRLIMRRLSVRGSRYSDTVQSTCGSLKTLLGISKQDQYVAIPDPRNREIILAMPISFVVDGRYCDDASVNGDVHRMGDQVSVLIRGITDRGCVVANYLGNPQFPVPFRENVIQKATKRKFCPALSAGFVETFSGDGKTLVSVDYVSLEKGAVRRRTWGLNVPTPILRLYATHHGRLIWHFRQYNDSKQPSVICLDEERRMIWAVKEKLDIIAIHTNDSLVAFLVAPGPSPFYSVHIVDDNSGEILRVLELSWYDISNGSTPNIVLTDTHLIFSFAGSDLRYQRKLFLYDIDELLRIDYNYNPRTLNIPEFVNGNFTQIQVSTDNVYLGVITTFDIPAKTRTREISLLLYDMTSLKKDPQIRNVTRQAKNRKGVFTAGLWCIEKRDDDIDIEYFDIPV